MEPAAIVALVLVVLGLILLIIEATSPGVFMIIPASVLIILGAFGLINPDFLFTWWAILIAILVAIPVTVATIYFYRFLGKPQPPSTTITDTLVGSTGIVIVKTIPGSIKGKIRLDSDTWSANSEQPIEVGVKAKVIRSEGVHVFIEPVE